ncbi:MAG: SGNH/GDSL hydrolase family protein [Dehalococcoidia bacterium]
MDQKQKKRITIVAALWILFGISAMVLFKGSAFLRVREVTVGAQYSAQIFTIYSVLFILGYLLASGLLILVTISRHRREMLVKCLRNRWVLTVAVIYVFILLIVALFLHYSVAILLFVWTVGLFATLLILAKSEKQLLSWMARIFVMFLSLLITIYAVEGLIRVSKADLGFNGRQGGYSYTWGHKIVNNSLGFREKEFIIPKPQNVYRIMVLGDSFTQGVGLAEEERYSDRLEALLATEFHAKKIEVLNFGVWGIATVDERNILMKYKDIVKPDLIIVGFCQNDTQPRAEDYSIEKSKYDIYFNLIDSLSLFGLEEVKGILHSGYQIVLTKLGYIPSWQVALQRTYEEESPDWKQFVAALQDIKTMSDDIGLPSPVFAVLNSGWRYDTPTDYNNPDDELALYLRWYNQAENAARKIGFTTVNFKEEFARQLPNEIMAVNRYDRHPNSRMNEIYAQKLFQVVAPIIRSTNER